jgi:hypothetical protein
MNCKSCGGSAEYDKKCPYCSTTNESEKVPFVQVNGDNNVVLVNLPILDESCILDEDGDDESDVLWTLGIPLGLAAIVAILSLLARPFENKPHDGPCSHFFPHTDEPGADVMVWVFFGLIIGILTCIWKWKSILNWIIEGWEKGWKDSILVNFISFLGCNEISINSSSRTPSTPCQLAYIFFICSG